MNKQSSSSSGLADCRNTFSPQLPVLRCSAHIFIYVYVGVLIKLFHKRLAGKTGVPVAMFRFPQQVITDEFMLASPAVSRKLHPSFSYHCRSLCEVCSGQAWVCYWYHVNRYYLFHDLLSCRLCHQRQRLTEGDSDSKTLLLPCRTCHCRRQRLREGKI